MSCNCKATKTREDLRTTVREGYAGIATKKMGSCCSGTKDAPAEKLAAVLGYAPEELDSLPEGANMGLSCGNPVALASLKPGEIVVDLGSGGGFDVFIAGRKVGPTGRAIGVDMTAEMLAKARKNAEAYAAQTGFANAEFRLGEIEHLPLADNSVDVVISNCVINLSPDKPQVWREIARVLKSGGRAAVTDTALVQDLPPATREDAEALVGCLAGAVHVEETEGMVRAAGLDIALLEPRRGYVEAVAELKQGAYQAFADGLPEGATPSDYIVSLAVNAVKP